MTGPYYRQKAERCRLMSALGTIPEVKEQLRLWAHEFDDLAEDADRKHERRQELSLNFGDGLRVQAAAVWDFEDAELAATSIPSVNRTP
jgi:hypothetical protein